MWTPGCVAQNQISVNYAFMSLFFFKLIIFSFEFNFLKIKYIYSYFVNLMVMSRFCDL